MKTKYSKYKSSGVEWIGEIPKHWEVTRIKYLPKEGRTSFIDGDWIESNVITDSGIRYLTSGNIGEGVYKEQGKGFISEQTFIDLNCSEVFEGDLIISRLFLPVGRCCIIPNLGFRIITCVDNVILRPKNNISKRFLVYEFNSVKYFEHTELISRGTTLTRISGTMLGNIFCFLPPLPEQEQIVKFLDEKTSQIDNLISITEKKIELLKQKRTSLINTVVTKGLNTKVELKESGVKWIGKIPKHWERISVKRLVSTKLTDGPHTSPNFTDSGVPFISVESIKDDKIDFDYKRGYISEEDDIEFSKKSKPQIDDILLVKSGSTTGKVTIVETDLNFNIWSPLCLIRPNKEKVLPRFVFLSMKSEFFQLSVQQSWSFGTQPNIGMGVIENIFLVVPPIIEQEKIINYIDTNTKEIDELVSIEQRRIETLKEYKQSLISEVVTGKVRVCKEDNSEKENKHVLQVN